MFIIENVFMSESDESLTLISLEGEEITFKLYGDCCSSSYFDKDSKVDAASLMGDTLLRVEYNSINSTSDEDGRIIEYALILKTNRQSISLMWRNASNGYYSGSVTPFLNGVSVEFKENPFSSIGVEWGEGY